MKNKRIACFILTAALLSGIMFFGCEQFGTGGDISNILYGRWNLTNDNLPDGINLSVNFGVSGSFNLTASADVDALLELIADSDLETYEVCPICGGFGVYLDEECFYCDGEGSIKIENDNNSSNILDGIDLTEFINVKTFTLEIRGTYSDNGDFITIAPTEIKSNVFGAATSALRKVYGQNLNEILSIIGGGSEENDLIRKLLDLFNVNDILSELDKNLSGWVGTPQIKNILNYSYNTINSLLTNKLNMLGITEEELADYLEGDEEEQYPYLQSLSESDISKADLMIVTMLYSVKMTLNEVIKNTEEYLDSLFAEIPPVKYELESGSLTLTVDELESGSPAPTGYTFTR